MRAYGDPDGRLDAALELCGYPPLSRLPPPRRIGHGAWYDAWLVAPPGGEPLVVRLRKAVIYGGREEFDERLLRSEYAAVGLYYRQANRCRPGACPATYRFHVAPGLTFTIESYLGEPVALDRLSQAGAFGYGEEAGRFFRAMHDVPPEIVGFGEPLWRGDEGGALVGEGGRPLEAI